MKYYIILLLMAVLLVVTGNRTMADGDQKKQDKVDVYPEPVGGMKAIAANVKYPEAAKKKNVTGKVLVSTLINKAGHPTKVKVVQGIGSGCDEAAIKAIKKTKFKPATKDGKIVECEVTIPINFQLQEK